MSSANIKVLTARAELNITIKVGNPINFEEHRNLSAFTLNHIDFMVIKTCQQ